MICVSANHIDPRWQLDRQAFALAEAGEYDRSYRIGGDASNGYYASATNFGCGRTCSTPAKALQSLLIANGCTGVRIEDQ